MKITKKQVILGLALLFLILILLTYFTSAERGTKITVESITAGAKTVNTIVAEPEDVPLEISEVGLAEAFRQVRIIAESSGKVLEVKADIGDIVKQNDIIYVLEDELARLSAAEAEAGVIIAEASFEKGKKDYERGEKLFETNDISLNELESLKLAFKNAEGNLLRSRALFDMARRHFRDTRISTPVAGTVTARSVDVGEMVSQGMAVAEVVDAESLKVTLGITDTDISKVVKGQRCYITVDALPGRRFPGHVKSSSLKADEATGTFQVEVVTANTKDHDLRAGMVARVSIETGRLEDVILIQRDAVATRGGENIVFVVEGEKALRRPVRLGTVVGTKRVIEEGLSPGERVVIVGVETLVDGDTVREGK